MPTRADEDLTPERRLRLIVKAFEWSGEALTAEGVARQFRHETGRDAPEGLVRAAVSGDSPAPVVYPRGGGSIDDLF